MWRKRSGAFNIGIHQPHKSDGRVLVRAVPAADTDWKIGRPNDERCASGCVSERLEAAQPAVESVPTHENAAHFFPQQNPQITLRSTINL